jgi:dTDP-4-dehydrorhamnose 3,5-epimerase
LNFIRTTIPDVIICEPEIFSDERGYFVETFRKDKLENFLGFKVNFCQDSESKSSYGVLRGLHYQIPPYAQTKLVRVIKGKVLDIAIDIREGSPTFGKYTAVELSEYNKKQLFIPIGFAHGFVVLSEDAIFTYKVDSYYCPECERGIAFDDKDIDINWQINQSELQLSLKDTKQPKFKDTKELFKFESNYYA